VDSDIEELTNTSPWSSAYKHTFYMSLLDTSSIADATASKNVLSPYSFYLKNDPITNATDSISHLVNTLLKTADATYNDRDAVASGLEDNWGGIDPVINFDADNIHIHGDYDCAGSIQHPIKFLKPISVLSHKSNG
jgi:hypothetical protein